MSAKDTSDQLRLGFMTAVHLPDRGYVAGLLVTNRFGRPLEFQCTTPVKPNRTQELLYGPTLVPFILGELVSRTLVEKIGVKPHLILTDRHEILDLRNHVQIPVVCLFGDEANSGNLRATGTNLPTNQPAADGQQGDANLEVTVGNRRFRIHAAHPTDRETVEKKSAIISHDTDLQEPIDRVREALNETLGAGAVA